MPVPTGPLRYGPLIQSPPPAADTVQGPRRALRPTATRDPGSMRSRPVGRECALPPSRSGPEQQAASIHHRSRGPLRTRPRIGTSRHILSRQCSRRAPLHTTDAGTQSALGTGVSPLRRPIRPMTERSVIPYRICWHGQRTRIRPSGVADRLRGALGSTPSNTWTRLEYPSGCCQQIAHRCQNEGRQERQCEERVRRPPGLVDGPLASMPARDADSARPSSSQRRSASSQRPRTSELGTARHPQTPMPWTPLDNGRPGDSSVSRRPV